MGVLSKKAKYGIRSLIYLAKNSHKGPVLSQNIAADEKMPKKYLESILLKLKKAGLVLKIITGTGHLLTNALLTFDALEMNFRRVQLKRNPKCPISHTSHSGIRTLHLR